MSEGELRLYKDLVNAERVSHIDFKLIAKKLFDELQQKENIIKELNDKIEDDKMIIEGNWGCIDSLRKDYNLQKNIIKEVREYIEDWQRFPHTNGSTHKELKNLIDILDKENKQ